MSNKKQLVLDTTLKLITSNGIQGCPMSLIAREAEVAIGTIYHYFTNKQDLINQLFCNLCEQIGNALMIGDDTGKTIHERFINFYKNFFNYFLDNPDAFFFIEQWGNPPFIPEKIIIESKKYYQKAIDFLKQGVESGTLKKMNNELMTNFVYGCVVMTAKLHLTGEIKITPELLDQAILSCWDGVRKI